MPDGEDLQAAAKEEAAALAELSEALDMAEDMFDSQDMDVDEPEEETPKVRPCLVATCCLKLDSLQNAKHLRNPVPSPRPPRR